jgi:16S rRNA (guanine527-N7)-methyltransferase
MKDGLGSGGRTRLEPSLREGEAVELRKALRRVTGHHILPRDAEAKLFKLLTALAKQPHPPTTAHDPKRALQVHIADSLSGLQVLALIEARSVLDLGTGAGFPGLPLATALPRAQFDLLDSNRRSCEFVSRLARDAGIENVRVLADRAEDWAAGDGGGRYDVVTTRAVGPLPVLVEYSAPLLRVGGQLLAWKGARRAAEDEAGDAAARAVGLSEAKVRAVTPFPEARSRHLHIFTKLRSTPAGFPRRAGMAAKRPLA